MSFNFKKIAFQYSYLKLEFEDVKKTCDDKESEIRKFVKENYPDKYNKFYGIKEGETDNNLDSNNSSEIEDEICDDLSIDNSPNEKINNEDIKKIYRKIAQKTHPDVSQKQGDDKIFIESVKAYNEGNLANLIQIALSLQIEIKELSEKSLELIKDNIGSLEEDLHHQKNTLSWAWSQINTDEERHRIVAQALSFLENKGN